jgi:hypothetical protein
MGAKVVEFMKVIRQGLADGGTDASIFSSVYSWFNDDETKLVLRSLEPGIGLIGTAPAPHTAECSLVSAGSWGDDHPFLPFPTVSRLPTPVSLMAGVANVKTSPARCFYASGTAPEYFEAFRIAMDMPPATTARKRMDVMMRIAGELYGQSVAEDVVDAWEQLERAETMMNSGMVAPGGGPVFLRWLTRPLVAHQELLTEAEIRYWAPYLYQSKAAQPDEWLNYLNLEGVRMVETWHQATHVCCAIDGVEATLASAAGGLEAAASRATRPGAAARLVADSFRIRALRSMVLTVRHTLQVATLSQLRDEGNATTPKNTTIDPLPLRMPKGDLGDKGLWYMYRALRWELDNTVALIDLIKRSPVPLFRTPPHPSFTGPFCLESNLLESLEKKRTIMLKHWRSAEIGYYKPTLGG